MALNRESRGERTPPSPPLLAVTITPRVASTDTTFWGASGLEGLQLLSLKHHGRLLKELLQHFQAPNTLRSKLCKLAETRGESRDLPVDPPELEKQMLVSGPWKETHL